MVDLEAQRLMSAEGLADKAPPDSPSTRASWRIAAYNSTFETGT
jgi:hypothetical protein